GFSVIADGIHTMGCYGNISDRPRIRTLSGSLRNTTIRVKALPGIRIHSIGITDFIRPVDPPVGSNNNGRTNPFVGLGKDTILLIVIKTLAINAYGKQMAGIVHTPVD